MAVCLISPRILRAVLLLPLLALCSASVALPAMPSSSELERGQLRDWKFLPALPDREGFAGPFAGVSSGALLVAGGANFPDKKPWEGGAKVWHDPVFILNEPGGVWRKAGKLPRPLAYGVSVSTADGLLCAGGSDSRRHYAEVFLLRWEGRKLSHQKLPYFPAPCANMCGALLGNVLYVAGGIETPAATEALKTFWALDLAAKRPHWRALEPWPGAARMLAVAGVHDGAFYLFSGVALRPGSDGKPVRTYLRDAYCYRPGSGWARLADLPRAAAGAPSPAPVRSSDLLVISGDDGALVDFEPKSAHPGFPRDVLAYDPRLNRWSRAGESPLSRATVPAVEWRGGAVIPGGETRPGARSSEVWSLSVP